MSNAIKFTPAGGHVWFTARPTDHPPIAPHGQHAPVREPSTMSPEPHGDYVELTVRDTGIGIKPEDLPKLFQPFTHLEPAFSKQHPGAGLGLSLAKRLVEMHGGRIWAESEGEGRGSTFTVVLPVAGPGEPPAAPAGGPPS
jgi:signal transduction histidine kinase